MFEAVIRGPCCYLLPSLADQAAVKLQSIFRARKARNEVLPKVENGEGLESVVFR